MPPRQRAVRAVPVAAAPPVVPVAAAPPVPAQAGAGQAAAAPAAFSDSDDDQDPEALFGIDIEEGKLELAADMSTAFMLPWKTSGDRSGPQQAWQCLQCKATAGSQTFDITAYQTAVQTVAGDEYYIFSCVVHQPEPGSVDNGTASVTTTSLRGFKANNLSQRGRRAGGASQGLGADLRVDLDAQDMILEHNSIRHIRQLSSAEETMLRDHTGSGKGGKAGWFIVPDGVDAADRKPYFNRFLGLDASGQALAAAADSAGEKAWRATQLSNLYAQLMTEGSLKTVTHKDERVAFVEALPKVAAILVAITQAAEAPSDLAWSPTGQDLGIFVPALQTGLPRCVRQHLGQGLMPRPPEVMKRLGGKQPAKGGGSSGGGKTGADGSKRPRPLGRETIPTVAVHDESLTELAEALSSQVLELQSHYEKDMRVMMNNYRGLHAKYVSALALMNRGLDNDSKELALDILGVEGKWVSQPPPFDPGSRPFVDRPEAKASQKNGSVRRSGFMSSSAEQRPPPSEFAVARKFEPEEYTADELKKLDRELFKPVPRTS